jgi:hypothetical protein
MDFLNMIAASKGRPEEELTLASAAPHAMTAIASRVWKPVNEQEDRRLNFF